MSTKEEGEKKKRRKSVSHHKDKDKKSKKDKESKEERKRRKASVASAAEADAPADAAASGGGFKPAVKPSSRSTSSSTTTRAKPAAKRGVPAGTNPPPPADQELNAMFEKLLSDMGLQEAQKAGMRNFPRDQKWTLIVQSGGLQAMAKTNTPEACISKLKNNFTLKDAEALRISLGGESMSWLKKFVKHKGLVHFFANFRKLLDKDSHNDADLEFITECVRCSKALLNVKVGLEGVIGTDGALACITESMKYISDKTKSVVLEVLAALCLVPDAFDATFAALSPELESLIGMLSQSETPAVLKAAILTVINAAISAMTPQDGKDFRNSHNLNAICDSLRTRDVSESIETQLDIYEEWDAMEEEQMLRAEKEELQENFNHLCDQIRTNRSLGPSINAILQHLALLRKDGDAAYNIWELVDIFVQYSATVPVSDDRFETSKNICEQLLSLLAGSEVTVSEGPSVDPEELEQLQAKLEKAKEAMATLEKENEELKANPPAAAPAERAVEETAAPVPVVDEEAAAKVKELEAKVKELEAREPEIKTVEKIVEKIVEKPVEKIVEKVVEKIVYVEKNEDGTTKEVAAPPVAAGAPPPPAPPMQGGGAPPPPAPPMQGGEAPPPPAPPMQGGGAPPPPAPPMQGGGPPPPPPMQGGGGPPPPPPMGGPGGGPPPLPGQGPPMMPMLPKKKVIKPSVKMRGFMWNKIKKIEGTVWEDVDDEKVQVDLKELETLFCQKKPKPKGEEGAAGAGGVGGAPKKEKKKDVSLLDMKRSQNLSIMLSRFGKRSFEEIKKGIMELDEEVVSLENATALKNFAPEADEIAMLKEYTGDVSKLGKPERFVLAIADIPKLIPRLNCIVIKASFNGKYEGVEEAASIIHKAIGEINGNTRLKKMLEIVLALGNHMNGSTARGGAYGFKLDSLVKLMDVKSVDGSQTMMNYLAQYIEDKNPELADLPEDFPSLGPACRESIPQTDADLGKLKGEVNQVKGALDTFPDSPGDPFKKVFGAFHADAAAKVEKTSATMQKVKDEFVDLAKYFGENPKVDSQSFFESLERFISNFDKAKKDNKRRKALAEKAKAAEARKAEMAAKRGAAGAAAPGDGAAGAGRGGLDDLIGDMKSGMAFASRLRSTRGRGGGGRGGRPPPSDQGGVANEALMMFGKLKKTGKR